MRIKWLHISDIHLNKTGTETRRMRMQLISYLKSAKVLYDYLFVTGDLRYAPNGVFDPETCTFLSDVMNAAHVRIENVFIIPGNHDIDRENFDRKNHLTSIWGNFDSYYNSKEGIFQDEDLITIASGQEDFNEIIESFYADIPDRIAKYKDNLHPHFNIVADKINVLHVNSTLLYSVEHQNELAIGTYHLLDALMNIDKSKPTVLLSHYSFDFLNRNEQKEILRLLTDFNIQLWLAGHEHDEMLRRQRDFFYEFQGGNLLYEPGDTNSCVLVGNLDLETGNGLMQGLEWHTDLGWRLSKNISHQTDRSRYHFKLQDDNAMKIALECGAKSDDFTSIAGAPYAFETYVPETESIPAMPEADFKMAKKNLGGISASPSLENYDEENDDSYAITSVPWMQENGLSLLWGRGQEESYKGFLYLDGCFAPFMEVDVFQSHYDSFDNFLMKSDSMEIHVIKAGDMIVYISYRYDLSKYSDVDMRLFHFNKIKEYMGSNKVFVKMVGHETYNLNYKTQLDTDEWRENLKLTDYWIQQMQKISKIEDYYGIKFYLPIKGTDEDYLAIEVLSDSIDGKYCRTLPPMKMRGQLFRKKYYLKEKIDIECTDRLLRLTLFGYSFQPVRQYIIPGEYVWDKRQSGWMNREAGGVPICVDFEVSCEADKNRELISYISFEEYQNEFNLNDVPELDGELEKFFDEYVDLTYGIQHNHQLFLNYLDSLYAICVEDGENALRERGFVKKFHDKVTVNRLTDNAVSAGCKLVQGIDAVVLKYGVQDEFSNTVTDDNLGYQWMVVMNEYSVNGHFPIALDGFGEAYYDLLVLRTEAKNEGDGKLADIIDLFEKEVLVDKKPVFIHYDMIRNYSYTVAEIQKKYYLYMEHILDNYVDKMKDAIENNPKLVHKGKSFTNHIVYTLATDPTNMHIFGRNEDVMEDFYRFKNEADKHFDLQKLGMNNP